MHWIPDYNIILASKSPRRQQLLKSLGLSFSVVTKEVEEIFPDHLSKEQVPIYLAELKAVPFKNELKATDLLITADTIVCLGEKILGKPENHDQAFNMLNDLSDQKHQVLTGVCLSSENKMESFYASTAVQFKKLTAEEINYYITTFKPYDKAGAYGIQEWIGAIGITGIQGSYYNVMGLPIQKLYEKIQTF